jgi:hypothetical protein
MYVFYPWIFCSLQMQNPDIMSVCHQHMYVVPLLGSRNIFWPGAENNELTKDRHYPALLAWGKVGTRYSHVFSLVQPRKP